MITAPTLAEVPGVRHAFFTRKGGVSRSIYGELNCGLGSRDERERVVQNRAYVAGCLGVAADRLITVYQAHTAHCVVVERPFAHHEAQRADAMVTCEKGLALAVSAADCSPVLFATNGIIGAAHAGWRGALGGVIEATIAGMLALGAERKAIRAVIGPTISQRNYEVGDEVRQAFVEKESGYGQFFIPAGREAHFLFDLPGLIAYRLRVAGIAEVSDLAQCTYAHEERFFSYRRMTHRGEADYGRHLHGLVLT